MSDFKTKMHQIRFRLELRPRPHWGAYSAPPDPLAGFGGHASIGRGRRGEGKERGRGGEGRRGGDGKGRKGKGLSLPKVNFLVTSLHFQ